MLRGFCLCSYCRSHPYLPHTATLADAGLEVGVELFFDNLAFFHFGKSACQRALDGSQHIEVFRIQYLAHKLDAQGVYI